ncbi:MAG: ABC-type transport system involved in multi-copper enzyme maturation permease subunit, partial [Polyangiales bacterium]
MTAIKALFARLFADPNPILVKELLSTFRTPLFVRFLYVATGIVGIIVLMSGALAASGDTSPSDVGQIVFHLFFGISVAVVSLVAPPTASTVITAEREAETYESLILTGMRPRRIVWGKFLATYAVFALVLVAFSPVVGIAFLFGGVSPLQVFWGFFGLFLFLGPAVAFGVAVSARVATTRVAIIASTALFQPASIFLWSTITAMAFLAQREWGIGGVGPFWFAEALSVDFFRLDVFLLVFVLPIYVAGMSVWFFLETAIAAIRPPAEDRSTRLKLWGAIAVLNQTLIASLLLAFVVEPGDHFGFSYVAQVFGFLMALFLAAILMNEPPLPPRRASSRRSERFAGVLSVFGPGAIPTARYATVLVGGSIAVLTLVLLLVGTGADSDERTGLLVVGCGSVATATSYYFVGAWLRVRLGSGIASRVVAGAFFVIATLVTFFWSITMDGRSSGPSEVMAASPIVHFISGERVSNGRSGLEVALAEMGIYTVVTVFAALLLSVRVKRVMKAIEQRDALRDERRAARLDAVVSNPPEGS